MANNFMRLPHSSITRRFRENSENLLEQSNKDPKDSKFHQRIYLNGFSASVIRIARFCFALDSRAASARVLFGDIEPFRRKLKTYFKTNEGKSIGIGTVHCRRPMLLRRVLDEAKTTSMYAIQSGSRESQELINSFRLPLDGTFQPLLEWERADGQGPFLDRFHGAVKTLVAGIGDAPAVFANRIIPIKNLASIVVVGDKKDVQALYHDLAEAAAGGGGNSESLLNCILLSAYRPYKAMKAVQDTYGAGDQSKVELMDHEKNMRIPTSVLNIVTDLVEDTSSIIFVDVDGGFLELTDGVPDVEDYTLEEGELPAPLAFEFNGAKLVMASYLPKVLKRMLDPSLTRFFAQHFYSTHVHFSYLHVLENFTGMPCSWQHDLSKLEVQEVFGFTAKWNIPPGFVELKRCEILWQQALDHHYKVNPHHHEFFRLPGMEMDNEVMYEMVLDKTSRKLELTPELCKTAKDTFSIAKEDLLKYYKATYSSRIEEEDADKDYKIFLSRVRATIKEFSEQERISSVSDEW